MLKKESNFDSIIPWRFDWPLTTGLFSSDPAIFTYLQRTAINIKKKNNKKIQKRRSPNHKIKISIRYPESSEVSLSISIKQIWISCVDPELECESQREIGQKLSINHRLESLSLGSGFSRFLGSGGKKKEKKRKKTKWVAKSSRRKERIYVCQKQALLYF